MKIRSIDKDIKDILESGFYRIPRFQRPYSWDRENIEDFWNDVVVNGDADYFIGSMVVFKPQHSAIAGVVDGQQRLTTITMILAALRNALKDNGLTNLAGGVHNLIERRDINNQPQYVLQTETSYPYLQDHIQNDDVPQTAPVVGDEEFALKSCFDFITSHIGDTIKGLRQDKTISKKQIDSKVQSTLTGIRDKVLGLKLIFIDLDNEDDAYLIFETLNTRGKDLMPADLVKSHLTKLLKPSNKNVDHTKDAWNSMVEVIEGSSADLSVSNYLHHYWLSRHEYVTAKNLYKDLKRKVNKSNAGDVLKSLVRDARTYREIQEPGYRKWTKNEQQIRDSLEALNLFRLKQPLPLVLAVMHAFDTQELKQGQVEDILGAIEKLHFIFTAITSQRSSGGISFMYALHARKMLASPDVVGRVKVLGDLRTKLKGIVPGYAEFEPNFVELRFSRNLTKQKKLIQYVLAKIDRTMSNNGVALDYSQMTIEHIAPQSAGSGTLKDDEIANIGNLLLVEKAFNGSTLGSKGFAAKKELLEKSKVFLDPVLANATVWTATQIEERAKWMAKSAYDKVWKI